MFKFNKFKMTAILFVCGAMLLMCSPPAPTGQIVSGVYRVTNTADLGMQMRVTMDIRLTNAGADAIVVSHARLREFRHARESEGKPAGVTLAPSGYAEFTQEFTVSKEEYELWNKGARPHLALTIRVAGGPETTMTVALMQLPGSR